MPEQLEQEAPSSLYSCACVHGDFCTTTKTVILLYVIYMLYIPDVIISNESCSTPCRDTSVTLFCLRYCLELEVRVAGSQVTGRAYDKATNRKCTIVTPKKKRKNGGQTLTHAAARMSRAWLRDLKWRNVTSASYPGPNWDFWRLARKGTREGSTSFAKRF